NVQNRRMFQYRRGPLLAAIAAILFSFVAAGASPGGIVTSPHEPTNTLESNQPLPLADAASPSPPHEGRARGRTPPAREASYSKPVDEWTDPDTGHRVVCLSRLPGRSESLYFHQNAFTREGDKMVFFHSASNGPLRLFVLDMGARAAEPLADRDA